MARETRRALPGGVEAVRRRIEHWRLTREKRTRMPEALWRAAASAARRHGLWAVSRALRLNYESLKGRVEGMEPGEGRGRDSSIGFVELDARELVGPSGRAGSVVEMSSADGAKLMVHLEGQHAVDILALAESFWGRDK